MDAGACHELGRLQILVPHLEPTKIHVLSNTVLDFLQNQTSEPEYEVLLEHLKVRPQTQPGDFQNFGSASPRGSSEACHGKL